MRLFRHVADTCFVQAMFKCKSLLIVVYCVFDFRATRKMQCGIVFEQCGGMAVWGATAQTHCPKWAKRAWRNTRKDANSWATLTTALGPQWKGCEHTCNNDLELCFPRVCSSTQTCRTNLSSIETCILDSLWFVRRLKSCVVSGTGNKYSLHCSAHGYCQPVKYNSCLGFWGPLQYVLCDFVVCCFPEWACKPRQISSQSTPCTSWCIQYHRI